MAIVMFCILVGRFCPFLQGMNERFLLTVHVGMYLEFSHMPDDLIHILGFGRRSLDVVKLVTVIPVANVLSYLFLPSAYKETSRNKF
jgi:hypothetical protein